MLAKAQPDFRADFAAVFQNETILPRSRKAAHNHVRRLAVDLVDQAVKRGFLQRLDDSTASDLNAGIRFCQIFLQCLQFFPSVAQYENPAFLLNQSPEKACDELIPPPSCYKQI